MRVRLGYGASRPAGKLRLALLLLSMAIVASACAGGGDGAQAPDEQDEQDDGEATGQADDSSTDESLADRPELTVRLATQDMADADPAFMSNPGSWWVGHQIYSGLVRSDTGIADYDEVQPDLAEDWEISDDGTEYTFYLREGAQWHRDYGEVTASDVKFSFDRIKDPEVGSLYEAAFEVLEEVEVVDDYTVKLHLSEPSPAFFTSVLTFRPGYIVSEAAVTEMGAEEHGVNPIGSGPFVFEHWQPDFEVYLSANDDYYLGPPQISGVRMKVIPDEASVAIALENGEIQIANLQEAETMVTLEDNPDITIDTAPSPNGRYLWSNVQAPPMDDVRVRRALWHATDREAISAEVFDGFFEPMDTILPPSLWSHTDDVMTYDYDPDRARELLEEAGHGDGLELSLLYSERPWDRGLALAVQDMWRQVGVEVELRGRDHPVYTSERQQNRDAHDIILHHFGRTTDPHSILIDFMHSEGASNMANYFEVDDLIAEGASEPDLDRRREIYEEIQRKIQEDAPGVPTVNTASVFAVRPEIQGHVTAPNILFAAYPISIEP